MIGNEFKNIISRIDKDSERNLIQAAFLHLRTSQSPSGAAEKTEFVSKKDEVEKLSAFATQNECWYFAINENYYIGEGAEQQVFLSTDGKNVVKINDTVFYEKWEDYLISLLIHNELFPATAYELVGFYKKSEIFYSVVKQPFIESTQPTDLIKLKLFLELKGFKNKKNNDYFHPDWGIILEDLHDENVLTNQDVFFFIDTVIYLLN